jgi:hypothetical protein
VACGAPRRLRPAAFPSFPSLVSRAPRSFLDTACLPPARPAPHARRSRLPVCSCRSARPQLWRLSARPVPSSFWDEGEHVRANVVHSHVTHPTVPLLSGKHTRERRKEEPLTEECPTAGPAPPSARTACLMLWSVGRQWGWRGSNCNDKVSAPYSMSRAVIKLQYRRDYCTRAWGPVSRFRINQCDCHLSAGL